MKVPKRADLVIYLNMKSNPLKKKKGINEGFINVNHGLLQEALGLKDGIDYIDSYYLNVRKIFDDCGFVIEPAYPHRVNIYWGDYYIRLNSTNGKSSPQITGLHLFLRTYFNYFIKKVLSDKSVHEMLELIFSNHKLREIDKVRLTHTADILKKEWPTTMGTVYYKVGCHVTSKTLQKKIARILIESIKNLDGTIDKKRLKGALDYLCKCKMDIALSEFCTTKFVIVDKNKLYDAKATTNNKIEIKPHNPYLDDSGNLKVCKKYARNIKKTSKMAQKVISKHVIDDDLELSSEKPILKKDNKHTDTQVEETIHRLKSKKVWTMDDLRMLSSEFSKMPLLLVSEVNEYCDDVYGDFLLNEEDDIFTLNKDILDVIYDSKKNKAS